MRRAIHYITYQFRVQYTSRDVLWKHQFVGVLFSTILELPYFSYFLIPRWTAANELMAALFRSLNFDIDRVMQALMLCD
ncbi:hypothetical protein MIR68_003012 [Amoeboaphelidium protococcarum]|nr:hypothetical protein MIR68_003012 [Amoeboaphelidium protococcarum]